MGFWDVKVSRSRGSRRHSYEGSNIIDQESLDWGAKDDPLFEKKWLEDGKIRGFRSFIEEYYESCHTVHMNLLEALEEGKALFGPISLFEIPFLESSGPF